CSRPIAPPTAAACIPLDSALFHWRQAVVNHSPREKINDLAKEVAAVLASPDPQSLSKADRETRRLLLDWTGPLRWLAVCENAVPQNSSEYGVDPSLFGKHPNGSSIDPSSLC